MSFDPEEIIRRHIREVSRAQASRVEMAILTGCHYCERRILENDRPTPGAHILHFQAYPDSDPIPVCGPCFRILQAERNQP